MLRTVTLDYWDTIYVGASVPERVLLRQEALRRMLLQMEVPVPQDFVALYRESALEANRWWRDEHRGYSTADRIRWLLDRLGVERPLDCEHIDQAVSAVDETLILYPAPLLPGAREALDALRERYSLAIVSDTGFASGRAQDRLLHSDGLREHFHATVYSMDVGHAKPRPEIFQAALSALGVAASEALHVGDNERTDVGGALSMGMRAVRIDAVRQFGESQAEYVASSLGDLTEYLLRQA